MLEVWWRTQTWPLFEQTLPKPSRPEMLAALSKERGAGAARMEKRGPGARLPVGVGAGFSEEKTFDHEGQ